TAPPATTGTMDENVESTDKANNQFVGCELTSDNDGPTGVGSTGAGTGGAETVSATDCFTFTYDTNDRFFIAIDATDPKFDEAETERLLQSLNPITLERFTD
ncbi:MAG: DUF3341 domain-containing protein, partial [Actinobacteria bacterium]|nr:DUF3341 domain-containing protein [Actinomycetota bacterium]